MAAQLLPLLLRIGGSLSRVAATAGTTAGRTAATSGAAAGRAAGAAAGRSAAAGARGAAAGGGGAFGGTGMMEIAGKFGKLSSGIGAVTEVLQNLKPVVEELTKVYIFGLDYYKLKAAKATAEYFEDVELFKTFNISFGSEYNVPFGTTKYWDETLRAINNANKELGIAGKFSEQIRKNILYAGEKTLDLGFSQKELTDTYKSFTDSYGRNIMLSGDELVSMTKISNTLGENYNQIFGLTKLYGASIQSTFEFLNKANKDVDKLGLNTKKVFSDLQSNIRLIDKFTFKNSVQGLANMVKQANRLGMEMQSIASFADSVYDPEGAIEAAASLQMLGGEFAKLGDPFTLLYNANNDLEAFTENLYSAAKGMGALNKETGMIELLPFEQRTLKTFAKITGQNLEDVSQQAKRLKVEEIVEQNLAPNLRQYTTKIAGMVSFEQGIGKVNVDGIKKSIKSLTEAEILRLSAITEESGKSTFDTLATANQTMVEQAEIFAQKLVMAANNLETLAIETKNAKDGINFFYESLKDPDSKANLYINESNKAKRGAAESAGKVMRGEDWLSRNIGNLKRIGINAVSSLLGVPFSLPTSSSDEESTSKGDETSSTSNRRQTSSLPSFKDQSSTVDGLSAVQKSSNTMSNIHTTSTSEVTFKNASDLSMNVYINDRFSTRMIMEDQRKFNEDILKSRDSNGGRNTGPSEYRDV